jgi:hypothetical protein
MKKRWFITGVVVLLAVVTVMGLFIPRPRQPPISREQFERIEQGMSREEVETILGAPPGYYHTRHYCPKISSSVPYVDFDFWVGDEGMVRVRFDDTGRAHWMQFQEITLLDEPWERPSLIDRMRTWLGL